MPTVSHRYASRGPLLEFKVGVSTARRRALLAKGFPVPPALVVEFLLDTGGDTTMIDEQHMRTLGIPCSGQRGIVGATSDPASPDECDTYDISLYLLPRGEDVAFELPIVQAFARPLRQGTEGMIGRDVLNKLIFVLDGPAQQFRITY